MGSRLHGYTIRTGKIITPSIGCKELPTIGVIREAMITLHCLCQKGLYLRCLQTGKELVMLMVANL